MSDETPSLRDTLSEAYDRLDAASSSATTAPESVETTSTAAAETSTETRTPAPQDGASPPASQRQRDEQGRFTKAQEAAAKPTTAPEGVEKAEKGKAAVVSQAKLGEANPSPGSAAIGAEATRDQAVRAPQSWKPAVRELAARLPAEFRPILEESARREKETTQALQQSHGARQFEAAFKQLVGPYEPVIRASGAQHPFQVVQTFLETNRILMQGTPEQKADTLAQAIHQFGVPVEALAAALDRVPQRAAAIDPNTIASQAREAIMRDLRAQAAQTAAQRNEAMLTRFSEGHEFFEDVREIMGDILAARRMPNPTEQQLEEVYNLACTVEPGIAGILKQRKDAEAAKAQSASTQQALAAASSVKSKPTAAPAAQPTGLREVLAKRYDELASR